MAVHSTEDEPGDVVCSAAREGQEEMKIWFHGTNVEAAKKIKIAGFRSGTWFAEHLEDALEFGGSVVIEVALDHLGSDWQMCVGDAISAERIVSITQYRSNKKFQNEKLRKLVFDSA